MSGGNRLFRAAFGACLATLLFAAPVLPQQDVEKPAPTVNEGQGAAKETPPPKKEAAEAATKQNPPAAETTTPAPPVENKRPAEPPCDARCQATKQRQNDDLVAQQSMARAASDLIPPAYWQVGLGFLGIILIAVTLGYTRKAAIAARDAVVEAKKITSAAIAANDLHERVARQAERAWLKVDAEILDNVHFNEDGDAYLRIKFMVENIGNSPAFAVSVHAKTYLFAPEWEPPAIVQLEFARAIRDIEQNDSGAIVFPGSDWKHTPVLKIWSSDAKRAREQTKLVDGTDDGHLRALVIGCVQYLTRPDDRHPSQTGFIYAIRVRRAGHTPGWLPDGERSGRNDIVLEARSLDPHAVT